MKKDLTGRYFLVMALSILTIMAAELIPINPAEPLETEAETESQTMVTETDTTETESVVTMETETETEHKTETTAETETESTMALYVSGMLCDLLETKVPEEPTKTTPEETVREETTIEDTGAKPHEHYSVNGKVLDVNLQDYLFEQLEIRGIEWMYEVSLCQIYQESGYDFNARNSNGMDMGLCQFRQPYWEMLCGKCGLIGGNIFNPYDAIYVYAWLTAQNLKTYGDVHRAISAYYTGCEAYNERYVSDVLSWTNTMDYVREETK